MSPFTSIIALLVFICQILYGNSIRISYTDSGKRCMSVCTPDDDNRNYCYTNYHHTEYCTPGTGDDIQYYTAMVRGNRPDCITHCGKFGEDYNWCWTAWSEWDYCTTRATGRGYSTTKDEPCISPCERSKAYPREPSGTPHAYSCYRPHVGHEEMVLCAPSPLNLTLFEKVRDVLAANFGEYAQIINGDFVYRTVEHCHGRVKRIHEEVLRGIGVDELATWYETTYATNLVRRTDPNSPLDQNGPVESYVTRPSVPIAGLQNVDLPLVIRARIFPRHRREREPTIPSWVTTQMNNMMRSAGDERGHLVAGSFSGPTMAFNFAPQTSWLNRRNQVDWEPSWWNMERHGRQFLDRANAAATDYMELTVVVAYGNIAQSRRPVGFAIRFTFNTNAGQVRDSGTLALSNDPNGCPNY